VHARCVCALCGRAALQVARFVLVGVACGLSTTFLVRNLWSYLADAPVLPPPEPAAAAGSAATGAGGLPLPAAQATQEQVETHKKTGSWRCVAETSWSKWEEESASATANET
jgi:hypothetical protein